MTELPDDDLDAVLEEAWRRLERGAADKKSGFNAFYVATLGAQGWPEQRTVILRRIQRSQRRLIFHTDRRAQKVTEIGADGRIGLLFWDPKAALQLRVWGQAQVLTADPLVEAEWERLHDGARAIYRVPQPPGRPLDDPAEGDGTLDDDGRDAFAVVPVTAMRLEWLHLRPGGHRRARFDAGGEGWQGRWIAP